MIYNHKLSPSEIEKKIPTYLYDRLERRWQQAEEEEKKIRTDTLVRVMPDLSQEQRETFLETYRRRFVPKYRNFLILQNKMEAIAQQDELLWKNIFGLSTKATNIEKGTEMVTLEEYHSMSPILVDTLDTLEAKQSRFMVKEAKTNMKDTSVDSQIVSTTHIEVNKEVSKDEPSATIVVLSTNAPKQPSGETPSPTPKVVPSSNTPSMSKGKPTIGTSLGIEVSLDEVIEMPQLELANITLEKKNLLQEILAKKKKKEELRREHKQKQVLYDV